MYPNYDPNSASTSSWTQADYTEPATPNRSNGEYSFLEDLFSPITAYDFMPPSPTDSWTTWTGGEPESHYIPEYDSNSSLQSGSLNQISEMYSQTANMMSAKQVKEVAEEGEQNGTQEAVCAERESEEGPVSDGHAESSGQRTNGSSSATGAGALEAPESVQTRASNEDERPFDSPQVLEPELTGPSSPLPSIQESGTIVPHLASASILGKRRRHPRDLKGKKVMRMTDEGTNKGTSEGTSEREGGGEGDNELQQPAKTRFKIADIPPHVLARIPDRTLTRHDISKIDPESEERKVLIRKYSFSCTISGEKGIFYLCPRVACGAVLTRPGDMGYHLQTKGHSSETYAYKCNFCIKSYSRRDALWRHLKTKHGLQ